jgi:hypothetical protein
LTFVLHCFPDSGTGFPMHRMGRIDKANQQDRYSPGFTEAAFTMR